MSFGVVAPTANQPHTVPTLPLFHHTCLKNNKAPFCLDSAFMCPLFVQMRCKNVSSWMRPLHCTDIVIKVRQELEWLLLCVGVNPLMGFSPLLYSLLHLTGGLMGADLTTGAGTSAGKNGLLTSHTDVYQHTHTHIHVTHSPTWGHKMHD